MLAGTHERSGGGRIIKILSEAAIKDKWVEIEHKMGFSGVTVEVYEDWCLHHDKPLVELAHRNCLRQVVAELDVLIKDVTLKSGSKVGALLAAQTRPLRLELKKEAEEKDNV